MLAKVRHVLGIGRMRVIAYDTETPLMRAAYQAPPMVCGQWSAVNEGGRVGPGHVESPETFLPRLLSWLADPECLLVGAETAFDILVPCTTVDLTREHGGIRHMARDLGLDIECPGTDLLERFVVALDQDRVTDIFIRQKLIDLARGCYRYERNADGTVTGVNRYNLADLARRVAGIDMPGESKKCSVCDNTGCPACPWRLRYAELRGVPISSWPREAYDYAALDPVATAAVWVNQWKLSTKIAANFPGVTVADVLAGEWSETRAALPLKAMAAYGLRTDPVAVRAFEANVKAQYAAVVESLIGYGLVRRTYKRDREALKDFIRREGLERHFTSADPSGLPAWSFARACFSAATQALGEAHPDAALLWAWYNSETTNPDLLDRGLSGYKDTKDTKAAHALVAWAHKTAGTEPGGQVPEALMSAGGKKSAPVPKTDKDSLGIAAELVESALARGALADDHGAADALRDYADLSHLTKQLSTDIPILKRGAVAPIHTRFETILETERTSSSKPNVQNQARGGLVKCWVCHDRVPARSACERCEGAGKLDLPGTRECFVPREGCVLIDADYSMLEIYALAQTCLWELGFSGMAEALRAGQDVHMLVAAQILGKPYDWCMANKKDKEVKNARNAAKAVNFGRPGGLSAKTMRSYAVKSYGVNLPVERWKEIIDTWNQTWPEMPSYFAYVNRQESFPDSGLYNVRYPSPKTGASAGVDGFRALATYCAACNTKYQRLGAKVAKRALWYVFKACYTRHAEGSIEMFGCRPVNFVHDQIFTEAPEARAHAAGEAQARLMNRAAREICPDVPPVTEPILTRRWSKNAPDTTRDASGQLVPWEDPRFQVIEESESE